MIKHAKVLSFEDEEKLWQLGVLGCDNPQQLVDTLLFLLGIHCCLYAGQEHRNLRSLGFDSQFSYRMIDGQCHIVYKEDLGCKTNKGGLSHKKLETKEVVIFPNRENRARYPVAIFWRYSAVIPMNRKTKALYLQPRKHYTPGNWYLDKPISVNMLKGTVKKLCAQVGLEGFYSNHSLRGTSATRMYQAGIEEQVISEISGRRSNCVQQYKTTNITQKCDASCALMALCSEKDNRNNDLNN